MGFVRRGPPRAALITNPGQGFIVVFFGSDGRNPLFGHGKVGETPGGRYKNPGGTPAAPDALWEWGGAPPYLGATTLLKHLQFLYYSLGFVGGLPNPLMGFGGRGGHPQVCQVGGRRGNATDPFSAGKWGSITTWLGRPRGNTEGPPPRGNLGPRPGEFEYWAVFFLEKPAPGGVTGGGGKPTF